MVAAHILAVGQQHQSLAALELPHDLVRRAGNTVVEHRAAGGARRQALAHLSETSFQLGARAGEVLHQPCLRGEGDQERLIDAFAQHLLEELSAGRKLLRENLNLAQAEVDQQTQRQGEIVLPREVADGLRLAVFLNREIVLVELVHEFAALIAHRHQQADDVDTGGELRLRSRERWSKRRTGREERKDPPPRDHARHYIPGPPYEAWTLEAAFGAAGYRVNFLSGFC